MLPLVPASVPRIKSFSPLEALSARLTAFFRCSKNSFPGGLTLALLSSAEAKLGSSEIALSKCCIESCISNFSLRSRPCRNSFRASSEEVVMGILPAAFGSVFVATAFLLVLSATFAQPLSATVAATIRETKRSLDLLRDIVFLLRVFAQERCIAPGLPRSGESENQDNRTTNDSSKRNAH